MNKNRTHAYIAKELARCIAPITKEVFRKRGFSEHRILGEWDKIVGAHLASTSSPIKVGFESGKKTEGVLHIQVLSVHALDFQHLEPVIVDRIATYFGYKAIGRLVLHQTNALSTRGKPAKRILTEHETQPLPAFTEALSACEDPELKERLAALGRLLGNPKRTIDSTS